MPKKKDFLHSIAKQLIVLDRAKNKIIKDKNSEALHQFRVALRRLRCLLPIVLKSNKKLDAAILQAWQALAKLSSPTRDAEVMLTLLGKDINAAQFNSLSKAYVEGITILKAALRTSDVATLAMSTLQHCQRRIQKTSKTQLKHQVVRQARQQIQALSRKTSSSASMAQWHQRRAHIKHLRYLNTLATTWLPTRFHALSPALKTAQTSLGELHDASVLALWLGKKRVKKSHWLNAQRDWKKLNVQLGYIHQ
ncbi:CHAD domain-containing protein [Deefgea piscis]|uniref:CHAD domain-containing protein n=1 Tax=Deefgea piscis TaxID=2739061 RepID=A0A6M8SR61_9NEIS|nr:CHAD domain-containing protein [Deefgea piscis]QKJ67772.1 CHAD domain-containing protein [Deefgea piscis]